MNAFVSYFIWYPSLLLAVKLKLSTLEIQNLIQQRSLASEENKNKIGIYFKVLFGISVIVLLSYCIYCLSYNNGFKIRRNEVVFIGLSILLFGILLVSFSINLK